MSLDYELPPHSSYSQLNSDLICGERLLLERYLKVGSQRPSYASLGGSAVHEVTEARDLALYTTGDVTSSPTFEETFERLVSEAEEKSGMDRSEFARSGRASREWPDKEDHRWWLVNGPAMVERWVNWRDSSGWAIWFTPQGTPAVELEINVVLGGVTVKGAIDRVYVVGGQLIVLDIKSGARKPDSPRQLGTYRRFIEDTFEGTAVRWGTYWNARTGSTGESYDLARYTPEFVGREYAISRKRAELGLFLPVPGNFCGSCAVRPYCSVMGEDMDLVNSVTRPSIQEEV